MTWPNSEFCKLPRPLVKILSQILASTPTLKWSTYRVSLSSNFWILWWRASTRGFSTHLTHRSSLISSGCMMCPPLKAMTQLSISRWVLIPHSKIPAFHKLYPGMLMSPFCRCSQVAWYSSWTPQFSPSSSPSFLANKLQSLCQIAISQVILLLLLFLKI